MPGECAVPVSFQSQGRPPPGYSLKSLPLPNDSIFILPQPMDSIFGEMSLALVVLSVVVISQDRFEELEHTFMV